MPVFSTRHEALPAHTPTAVHQNVIARKDHPAFAGRDRLVSKKAERSDATKKSRGPTAAGRTKCFSTIFDDNQTMMPGDCHDPIHIARLTIKMNRYDRLCLGSDA